jgi:NADH:ubiquinone oxidoreductase subunit 5 (subunit L)/multisubunit Na+/H+ antiporter MnhA subunit
MPDWIPLIILLLPILTGLLLGLSIVTGFNRGESGETMTSRLTLGTSVVVLILLGVEMFYGLTTQWAGYQELVVWLSSERVKLNLATLIDPAGLAVATVFSLLILVTMRFSSFYMHREAGYQRFFMILNFLLGAMLFITLSGNAFTAFIGWELAGLSSYLLIAYAYDRPTASGQASRVFITNRIGDAGFMMSLILSYSWLGDARWDGLAQGMAGLSPIQSGLILAGFALAAVVKSGQAPFTPWLTRALEGPTPSSAVFYGGVIVHAGVFLLFRLHGVLDVTPVIQITLLILSGLTLLYGWLGGLAQTDIKTGLIFSTIAQVAIMFIALALGLYTIAIIHLLCHAVFRVYQMLSSPSYLHNVNRPARSVPNWLKNHKILLTAAVRRFWLDHLADWLVVQPIDLLSKEIRQFDEQIVTGVVGLPTHINAIAFITEEQKRAASAESEHLPHVRGLLGSALERIAITLQWFEERLVLRGSGEGLSDLLKRAGDYLTRIDLLFTEPRYLWLIILISMLFVM